MIIIMFQCRQTWSTNKNVVFAVLFCLLSISCTSDVDQSENEEGQPRKERTADHRSEHESRSSEEKERAARGQEDANQSNSSSENGPQKLPLTQATIVQLSTSSLSQSLRPATRAFPHRIVGEATIYQSPREDSSGWDDTKISLHLFTSDPDSDSITIIPSGNKMPGVNIPAGQAREINLCERQRWKLYPERLRIGDVFSTYVNTEKRRSLPSLAVAPAVSYVSHTDSVGIVNSRKIHNFYRETLVFAADVTGDGQADIAKTRYCCDNPSVNPEEEDIDCYRCSTTYHRDETGSWVVTNHDGAC